MKTFFAVIGLLVVAYVAWYAYEAYTTPEVTAEVTEVEVAPVAAPAAAPAAAQ